MRRNKGFTLVEILIVVAIIAVLIVIGIPVFSTHLEKARAATCNANLTSCVHLLYAQEMTDGGTLTTAAGGTMDAALKTGMDAELVSGSTNHYKKNSGKALCPDGGEYVFSYNALTHSITGACTIHGSGNGQLKGTANADSPGSTLVAAYTGATGLTAGADIDSTAPGDALNLSTLLAQNPALAGALSGLNVKSWALRQETKNPLQNVAWFSDVDISGLAPGTKVRTVRYNARAGTYTAGYMTVTEKTYDYKDPSKTNPTYIAFSSGLNGAIWQEATGQTNTTKASYEETLKVFNTLEKTK